MPDSDIKKRLERLEKEMKTIKFESGLSSKSEDAKVEVKKMSKKFLQEQNLDSAQNFLKALDKASSTKPGDVSVAWTTITVTVLTFMSDDHGQDKPTKPKDPKTIA